MDPLDARILLHLDDDPDVATITLAGRLGIARNTVHARLKRLRESGTLREPSRSLDPAAMGYPLIAFISVELSQTRGRAATEALQAIPEVVEMHSTTGEADLLLKVVARDPADLHRIAGEFLAIEDVVRTNTTISLTEEMPLRLHALLDRLATAD